MQVLAISPDRVTVSARGLYRVRLINTGRIVGELMEKHQASTLVKTIERCGVKVEAVTYEAIANSD